MRMDQYIGLNDWGQELTSHMEKEVCGEIEGAWTDVVSNLYRYKGMHGVFLFEEYVQAEPWSSGPMYFVALKSLKTGEPVPQSLWSDEEMSTF